MGEKKGKIKGRKEKEKAFQGKVSNPPITTLNSLLALAFEM